MSNFRPNKLVLLLALIHGAALAVLVAIDATMWTGILAVCVVLLMGPVGALTVFLRAVTASPGTRSSTALSTAVRFAAGALAFCAPVVVGLVVGQYVSQSRIETAQRWCESLASKIEEWRVIHGDYPEDLGVSGLLVDPPKLCDPRWLYASRDGTFRLSFYDERGFDSVWSYDPNARSWRHTN